MKRKLIIFAAVLMVSWAQFAQATPQSLAPYPAAYWVNGTLDKGAAPDPSGYKVVFYQISGTSTYADGYAFAFTDAKGNLSINALEDLRLLPLGIKSYYIGVVKKLASDGKYYGMNEKAIAVTADDLKNGYKNITSGLLSLKEGEGIPDPDTDPLIDTGWIQKTDIVRSSDNIILTWDYDSAKGATDVNIYYLHAKDAVYDTTKTFDLLATVASSTKTYTHGLGAHNGENCYYRIVPKTLVTGTTMFDDKNNSITAGKVETALPNNKYVFSALPFQSDNVSLMGILSEQLGAGGELLWWDGAGYHGATYSSPSWVGEDRILRIGEGFILRAKADKSVALVGKFGTLASPFTRSITGSKWNLIAYPYPTLKKFVDMGIAPKDGEDLLKWDVSSQAYNGATYSGSKWNVAIDTLELSQPRYYRPKTDFTWTITF